MHRHESRDVSQTIIAVCGLLHTNANSCIGSLFRCFVYMCDLNIIYIYIYIYIRSEEDNGKSIWTVDMVRIALFRTCPSGFCLLMRSVHDCECSMRGISKNCARQNREAEISRASRARARVRMRARARYVAAIYVGYGWSHDLEWDRRSASSTRISASATNAGSID